MSGSISLDHVRKAHKGISKWIMSNQLGSWESVNLPLPILLIQEVGHPFVEKAAAVTDYPLSRLAALLG